MDTRADRRPHLGDIAKGLFDSRVSGVDFWDTDAGRRLLEWERRGKPPGAQETGGSDSVGERGRPRPSWSWRRRG